MTMITPSYLGETIEYSSLHACRSTLEDPTVADAMVAVGREDFQVAVLDVNLDGEMVYPVADAVLALGVPFVFVTGYSAEGIDRRIAQVPVLQKPIERQMLQNVFVDSGRRGEAVGQ